MKPLRLTPGVPLTLYKIPEKMWLINDENGDYLATMNMYGTSFFTSIKRDSPLRLTIKIEYFNYTDYQGHTYKYNVEKGTEIFGHYHYISCLTILIEKLK